VREITHPREPRGKILWLISRFQKKYPWAQSLLELVPEVEIQYIAAFKTSNDIISFVYLYFMLIGRPIRKELNFDFRNKFQQVSVPRGISSGSEKRATEFYPWVPEDGKN
jgi:hypothetical protein